MPFYTFDHNGGSAVYASAHDLVRFGMFHLKDHLADQRPILADSTIDAMHRSYAMNAFGDSTESYGLGWVNHSNSRGDNLIGHSGGMPVVATILNLFPTENLAIVALTNGGGNPFAIAEDIAAVLLPKYALALKADRAKSAPPPRPAFSPTPELIGHWEGTLRTWQRTLPFHLIVEADGDVKVRIGPLPSADGNPPPDGQLESLLNDVGWSRGMLTGRFAGTIPTPDASWPPLRWRSNCEWSTANFGVRPAPRPQPGA